VASRGARDTPSHVDPQHSNNCPDQHAKQADSATSDPVEGAWVLVIGSGGGFFGGWSVTTTDAAGAYSIPDVVTGDHEVRVYRQGYFFETATVNVTDGVDTVADFALGGLTFGTVSGTVTDAVTGEAIEGAWVRVQAGGWTQTNRSACTR
jgi:hypothetical protein